MRHQDLGVMDGPLLFFGGPYSNLQATRAVLERARALGAACICTGDVVAYCARPGETVAAIRAADVHVVAGNCEIQLGAGARDCGCGFEAGSACDVLSAGWYGHADSRVGRQDRSWMADLPQILSLTHRGRRMAVIHGGVSDVARFLWPTSPAAEFEAEWDLIEARIGPVAQVWAGHCGLAFQRPLRRGPWVNAGVIGMPPHDGGMLTRYAVLEGGETRLCTLDYDAEAAARDMEAAGLTQGYHTALRRGYWPSEDVLPPDLRLSERVSG